MEKSNKQEPCDVCGGTGQLSFFKGVSRFLLSNEECDACVGTGLKLESISHKIAEKPETKPEKK